MSWGNVCGDSCSSNKKDLLFILIFFTLRYCMPMFLLRSAGQVLLLHLLCVSVNLPSSPFPSVSSSCFILHLVSSLTSSAWCFLYSETLLHTTPLLSTPSSPSPPPHCCIIQRECYLDWLVLSLSTSPLVALRAALPLSLTLFLPRKKHRQLHTRGWTPRTGAPEFIYAHLPFKCFPVFTDKCQAVLTSTVSRMLLLTLSFSFNPKYQPGGSSEIA